MSKSFQNIDAGRLRPKRRFINAVRRDMQVGGVTEEETDDRKRMEQMFRYRYRKTGANTSPKSLTPWGTWY